MNRKLTIMLTQTILLLLAVLPASGGKVSKPVHSAEPSAVCLHDHTMPTPSRKITSKFGHRWGRAHRGLDIKVQMGDTIRVAFGGEVTIVKYDARGYGKYVVVRHENGLETVYGHLSKQLVKVGDYLSSGTPVGLGGNTGRSTGCHLHFETRINGEAIDPSLMFDFANQDVVAEYFNPRTKSAIKKRKIKETSKDKKIKKAMDSPEIAENQPKQKVENTPVMTEAPMSVELAKSETKQSTFEIGQRITSQTSESAAGRVLADATTSADTGTNGVEKSPPSRFIGSSVLFLGIYRRVRPRYVSQSAHPNVQLSSLDGTVHIIQPPPEQARLFSVCNFSPHFLQFSASS